MARHGIVLAAFTTLGLVTLSAQETPPVDPTPTPSNMAEPANAPRNSEMKARRDRFREMRERLDRLPPGQRKKALEDSPEWRAMSPDEKAHVRFVQEEREKRLRTAVEEALKVNGLQLNDAQKADFSQIYLIERRKLEETLRAEMDQHRRERLADLQKSVAETYRKQIGATPETPAAPAPTPMAEASPSPGAP